MVDVIVLVTAYWSL